MVQEDWKIVASAKGQTLEDFLITSANDASQKFFMENNVAKTAVRQEQEGKKEQSTPLPLLEHLKNRDR
jgi:hypothetical protein